MKIGIIGVENGRVGIFIRALNVEKSFPGIHVACLWGEDRKLTKKTAKHGMIPKIVEKPEQMLGEIDAVIVAHRHGKYHIPVAKTFVQHGIPVYIDKPFCCRAVDGLDLLKTAQRRSVAVASYSILPYQRTFSSFNNEVSKLREVASSLFYGPCDINSKHGGLFFYGTHLVEMAVEAFGHRVKSVTVLRDQKTFFAKLKYNDGLIVGLQFLPMSCYRFGGVAIGADRVVHKEIKFDIDPNYRAMATFIKMFKTGTMPQTFERILMPVAILEAIERSAKSKRTELVNNIYKSL